MLVLVRRPLTDGIVVLRPPRPGDAAALVLGRDEVFHRFLGEGSPHPEPTACIVVDAELVGWVDADPDQPWLAPGEVNIGYSVFAPHRRRGYATRAVRLVLHHLAVDTDHSAATVVIDPRNRASLAVAHSTGFRPSGTLGGEQRFTQPVPRAMGQRSTAYLAPMAQRYEYKVVELREGMVGGKMSGGKLEKALNEHGAEGWQLKSVTSLVVKGRLGPGGVEGVLVTFERPTG